MKFIVDTDMGIDDAVALLMVLGHPQTEIVAITSVVGNIPLKQATHNAGVILAVAGAPTTPIFAGCAKPLMQSAPLDAMEVHGSDGLGGAARNTNRPVEPEHAVPALIRLAREQSGTVILLTLGPLTNIALAIRLDPTFLSRFERIVIMAGSVDGRGNTTAASEFNVAVDPEAAKIVFDACDDVAERVWLVSWEVSREFGVPFDVWRQLIAGDSTKALFVQEMTNFIEQVMSSLGWDDIPWADPLAAAVALAPEIVTAYDLRLVDVETGSNVARGGTVVDYRLRGGSGANMKIVRQVSVPMFESLLRLAVS